MTPTRNNPAPSATENGSIESAHGRQESARRCSVAGPRELRRTPAWPVRRQLVGRGDLRDASASTRRMALNKLPIRKTADYEEVNVDVTSSSAFTLRKVFYSVPSRLIGHRLRVPYDDGLEYFQGSTPIVVLRRGRPRPTANPVMSSTTVTSSIPCAASPWRCSIWSIATSSSPAEPLLWRSTPCSQTWAKGSCRAIVGLLALAHERACEAELAIALQAALDDGSLPKSRLR